VPPAALESPPPADLRLRRMTQIRHAEVKVGIQSVIHAALLPRLIGWGRARW